MKLRIFLLLCVAATLVVCKSGSGASGLLAANQPIKLDGPASGLPSDSEVEAMREAFFARAPENEEVYRVFVTSDGYARKQVAFPENITLKEDKAGDQAIAEEFKKFDMVNSLQEGQIRVELYPSTGKFYRVRQTKPSIMKETDKIMSDDITRWQFQFPKNQIVPKDFRVSYQVVLRKKITREQALKILSEQNKKK
jgi:hypothetical protein